MKNIILTTMLLVGLSCAQKQAPGPKIVEGTCARTVVLFVFTDDEGNPLGIAQTPEGCRCSISLDGREYVATAPEEDNTKCQKKETPQAAPSPGESL